MKDHTIFITGGNAGIGLATAKMFAREGVNIALVGRRDDRNEEAAAAIESLGVKCLTFAGDVTDEAFMRSSIRATVETFGGLNYAFNNAGMSQPFTPLPDQTLEDFRRLMDVNVTGVWLAMREEIPHILNSGGGCVVNTASVAGHIGVAQMPAYIASKHAVLGLTKSVALEYAQQGVRINAVSPGVVSTDLYHNITGNDPETEKAVEAMHPMGRYGTVDEVASAVLYLCRDATWTTGQDIVMDGGFVAN